LRTVCGKLVTSCDSSRYTGPKSAGIVASDVDCLHFVRFETLQSSEIRTERSLITSGSYVLYWRSRLFCPEAELYGDHLVSESELFRETFGYFLTLGTLCFPPCRCRHLHERAQLRAVTPPPRLMWRTSCRLNEDSNYSVRRWRKSA
jgi:hypothetical protein